MADGTPKKPSITFSGEVCNINASEPSSATKADGAQVRLPTFVVDDVLASTASMAAGSTSDVLGDANASNGIAARVQIAAAKNVANAHNQALVALGTIDTDGSQAALAAPHSVTFVRSSCRVWRR